VRVAVFVTCFDHTLLPETGRATVALLERLAHPPLNLAARE
jgi:L-lactate dehydrogenase complex protein LldE